MTTKKKLAGLLVSAVLAVSMLFGCTGSGVANNAQATAENPMVLNLAHNLAENHIASVALQQFTNEVNEKSGGYLQIRILPNDTPGSETEILERLMVGVVDVTRVSAPGLAIYNEDYRVFGLPYIFDDNKNYYKVVGSDAMGEFFRPNKADGSVTLTYYTSGSRSFYTIDKLVHKLRDLKGLKMRMQDMKSQTDMTKTPGGTPVATAMGNVYTTLRTGVIDGSENNETVLITGMHDKICKYFSVDQRTMIPDVLVTAMDIWSSLPEGDRQILLDMARNFTDNHIPERETAVSDALKTAKTEVGTTIVEDMDKEAFHQATASMIDEYREQYPKTGTVLDIIDSTE